MRETRNTLRLLAIHVALLGTVACAGGENTPPPTDELPDEHAGEEEHADDIGRVELGEAAFANAGIVVSDVAMRAVAAGANGQAVPGQVEFDPARVALVSPRTSGRIERLGAVQGDRVRAGQTLAWVLSPAFLTAQTDYVQALRRADLMAGTDDEQGARAVAEAARRRLDLLGADSTVIDRLLRAGEPPLDLIPVNAPFAGSILEAHALTGAAVESGSPIFTLADLSVVNVIAEVPERSLAMLRRGQTARIELTAYPDAPVEGIVERIREQLDPEMRTAHAVLRVSNPRGLLRPGMFASVHLHADANGPRITLPVVPIEAVITDGAERYVFVEVGPRAFERREVDVEPIGPGEVVVRAGLAAGDRVVTRGAFTLKSELAKGELGGHAH